MSDSAKGTISGFIFQFEKALLMLSNLKALTDEVSLELSDDVAVSDDTSIIIAIQAKHSISTSKYAFQDTSYDLWRTLQIWVEKFDKNIFNKNTKFICCSNNDVDDCSLLRSFTTKQLDEVFLLIQKIRDKQNEKLKIKKELDENSGKSIEKVLKIINSLLRKKETLAIVISNIEIQIEQNIKEQFLNNLHLDSDKYTLDQRDKIYHEFYGWIFERSKAKWCNALDAKFSKKEFNDKFFHVFQNPSITNLVFRTKRELDSTNLVTKDLIEDLQGELFIKQIEDIDRRSAAKQRIIKDSIHNFIYYDVELAHIVKQGNYTEPDFNEFSDQCMDNWREHFDGIVVKDPSYYSDEKINSLAVQVFDSTMKDTSIEFKNNIKFNPSNQYFKKGCLLMLSNIPEVGWHPEWEIKYLNEAK